MNKLKNNILNINLLFYRLIVFGVIGYRKCAGDPFVHYGKMISDKQINR